MTLSVEQKYVARFKSGWKRLGVNFTKNFRAKYKRSGTQCPMFCCHIWLTVGPCKTGKFSLRPYQNDYGNKRLRLNNYGDKNC